MAGLGSFRFGLGLVWGLGGDRVGLVSVYLGLVMSGWFRVSLGWFKVCLRLM